ncbi:MAG: Fe-S cluster assembly protein SufD [Planctomycetaceae bacterium]|nr:Fe-S cluster assembly protein SufD [Planctomycetaceae bacterium]
MPPTTVPATGFTQEAFDAFLQSRNEPGWLSDLRREAWQTYCEKEVPSRNEEEWMRTDIRLFKLAKYGIPGEGTATEAAPSLLDQGIEVGGSTSTVNGVPIAGSQRTELAEQGVIFGNLTDLIQDHGDLIRQHLFQRAVDPHQDKFSALHAACWTSGSFLYVPRGVVVKQPFHSLSSINGQGVDLGHTLVVVEDGAEVTFLNEMRCSNETDSGLHCGATELIVGSNAMLRFVNLQDWSQNVWHFAHQSATVDRDASLQWTVGALGSRLAKVNQNVALTGLGAECQVNGVMFTEGKQHLSYHTMQHHVAPHCRSDFLYKAALQDTSRTVWRGMIKVDEKAQKTDGYQRNDNLLLSGRARADAIPGLEIEADDVRCTHGATTGRVDEELIFYAQARGYTRREAVRLIVTGFFQQVFDRITIDSVRDALGHAIARRVRDYE